VINRVLAILGPVLPPRLPREPTQPQTSPSAIEEFRAEVSALRAQLGAPAWSATIEELRAELSAVKAEVNGFTSMTVADFPALFAEFRGKRFTLLWRGSRDGFSARDFHRRCDGYAPTLTLIEDTNGNIFGGFTLVKWDSSGDGRADPGLKSFLFTLKNPHNFPPRKFGLKAEQSGEAIVCDPDWGPRFHDMDIYNEGNANPRSFSDSFGVLYVNDTGMDRKTFFTGSETFAVKEIEIFEIAR
jgi:hypothetical protein